MRRQLVASVMVIFPILWATDMRAQDAGDDQLEFSQLIAKYHTCSELIPDATQTIDSSNRLGAILTLNQEYLAPPPATGQSYRGEILTRDRTKPWCTPADKYPLPTIDSYQTLSDIPERQEILDVGGSVQIAIGQYLKLLNISAENIKGISLAAANVKSYELSPGRQNLVMDALIAQPDCVDALQAKTSKMIVRVCSGDVTLGVYFKTAVSGSILNLAIGQLTAGINFHYLNETSSVVPCTTTAPATKAGSTTTKQPTAPAAAKSTGNGAAKAPGKSTTAAPVVTKSGVTLSVTGNGSTDSTKPPISFSVSVTSGGNAPQSNPAASPTPAASPKPAASPSPSASPTPAATDTSADPAKCYSFAKVIGPSNGVFGINLSPQSGADSVSGLFKARKK
jgi:hypothetical protein